MTARRELETALSRAPGGLPAGDFTARQRADVNAILARRFPGFSVSVGRSKAQAIGDLAEFLLARQTERSR